jgi:glycosyltransferase involved in cell wall biosynthesis
MRLALIQDQLLTEGGSERVFLEMCREFPEADIFTLAYNRETTLPGFRDFRVRTSWMNRFVRTHDAFKMAFPAAQRVMEAWDFRGYDVLLTSSATTAKYVRRHDGLHVCYCYFPTRAIWTFDEYFPGGDPGLRGRLFQALLPYFKRRDLAAAARVDRFIGISETSARAIRNIYGREAEVLHSPIDAARFRAGMAEPKEDHFLIVSRLQRWKRLDYAIEAFNRLGLPLRIIGHGPDESRLRALAGPTVRFAGYVDDDALVVEYGRARAVVFTPKLEYGLVPLEANAAGTPVIALGKGAMPEIMVPVDGANANPTAVFFHEQTPEAVVEAVRRFERTTFDPEHLVGHARRFDVPEFRRGLRRLVVRYATCDSRAGKRDAGHPRTCGEDGR